MNKQEQSAVNPWAEAEVISVYTRAQALEDGVLVDLTDWAREAGFKLPVAVTQGVWCVLTPSKELAAEGQDVAGRAWDMFTILRHAIRGGGNTDTVYFAPLFTREVGREAEGVEMYAKCGPGDNAEPVITVMLRGED